MKQRYVTEADLLTILEDTGLGRTIIAGADARGIVIDGYLDLNEITHRLNRLIEIRERSWQLIEQEQCR